jgi:hypothetical protein
MPPLRFDSTCLPPAISLTTTSRAQSTPSRLHCISNRQRTSINWCHFQKLQPPAYAAPILLCLASSPPPNCLPSPMMVYKMVAYQQPMQDSNFSLTSHHPLGHSTATRELYRTAAAIGRCQLARPPNPLPPLVTIFPAGTR